MSSKGVLYDRAAVARAVSTGAGVFSQTHALIALGISPAGDNFRRLREACSRYGVPVPSPSQNRYAAKPMGDANMLRHAVEGNPALSVALSRLGMSVAGKNYVALANACQRLAIDYPRSIRYLDGNEPPKVRPGTPDDVAIAKVAAEAMPVEQLRELSLRCGTASSMLAALGLQSHQSYRVWLKRILSARGVSCPGKGTDTRELTDDEFFVVGARRSGSILKIRAKNCPLVKSECCAECGMGWEWQGRPISLELDHISGDRLDNRRENLRFLCPNCHSQTETFRRRKVAFAA